MRKVLLSTVLIGSLVAAEPAIIPLPKTIEEGEGAFSFTNDFGVRYDPALEGVAKLFASDLGARTGSEVGIKHEALKTGFGVEIVLDLDESLPLKPGGYRLKVTPDRIRIRGKDVAGAWHATRSILQMLPPKDSDVWKRVSEVGLPALLILDEPRFAWRGMHLDVGRHFFPVVDIKKFIDWLAFHKLNTLHWHLTEDQGCRKLDSGVLEASSNGSEWTEIATFKDGAAEGSVPAGATGIRIRVTKPQDHWFTIGEIVIE
jgi:hexosaminidase